MTDRPPKSRNHAIGGQIGEQHAGPPSTWPHLNCGTSHTSFLEDQSAKTLPGGGAVRGAYEFH